MTEQNKHELNLFIQLYEDATNSHDFDQVERLLTEDAQYFFSDGTYQGLAEIRAVFERNWETIKEEVYRIRDVNWMAVSESVAVCTYIFQWQGYFHGELKSGEGRGTNVLVKHNGQWLINHEHLSSPSS